MRKLMFFILNMDLATVALAIDLSDYRNHPCRRECTKSTPPMICQYDFRLETYHTMSMACYDCPYNQSDCLRSHCVAADGVLRGIKVVNRMMPGPSINICEGDTVVVDVYNGLMNYEGTSIHWHGIIHTDTPYMDGVVMMTQCPIPSGTAFRYSFKPRNSGTHFWHAHAGLQQADGIFGAFIIRQKTSAVIHLYDYDLLEHTVIIHDWFDTTAASKFTAHHHAMQDNHPRSILINGRGSRRKFVESASHHHHGIKKRNDHGSGKVDHSHHDSHTPSKHKANVKTTTGHDLAKHHDHMPSMKKDYGGGTMDHSHHSAESPTSDSAEGNKNKNTDYNTTSVHDSHTMTMNHKHHVVHTKSADTDNAMETSIHEDADMIMHHNHIKQEEGSQSTYHLANMSTSNVKFTPHAVFRVKQGMKYRFRFISNGVVNCPLQVYIDDHMLTVIATDGEDIEPYLTKAVNMYSGERYDIVVHASQPVGNYWIRVVGMSDCDLDLETTSQTAILSYETSREELPKKDESEYTFIQDFVLNSVDPGRGHHHNSVAEMKSAKPEFHHLRRVPDHKFYLAMDFNRVNNHHYLHEDFYPLNHMINRHHGDHANHLMAMQINHISYTAPHTPPLTQYKDIPEHLFCNESSVHRDCNTVFCECTHRIKVGVGHMVEMILIGESINGEGNHPMHLHGHQFWVLGMKKLNTSIRRHEIEEMDAKDLLPRNYETAIKKDTVLVPDGGYTIIRFHAENPGFWLFHCHVEFHMVMGLALVIQVGEVYEMPQPPASFPRCGNWIREEAPKGHFASHVQPRASGAMNYYILSGFQANPIYYLAFVIFIAVL
ncbi:hypothetical protein CHS0354_018130 [Potamilus streckersoni]|uniref:Uncharacterized protein n=1 Tax=Potamilus streckersoni TaxID=2493646 RepID=A0AAE0SSP7_9BIVA|nr:hypothetical protein CHS0354_018130 [Potamilus streckersoni]